MSPTLPPPDGPLPPPVVTAVINGVPALTAAPILTLHITGAGLARYRAKVGPASAVDCRDTAGYGPETPVSAPLVIDLATRPDGLYRLCVVGGTAGGAWQPSVQASSVAWALDRGGPGAFTVNAVDFPAHPAGAVHFSWSASPSVATLTYSVAIAGPLGCAAPIATYKATTADLTLPGGLPGGRFAVCVTAADALGNQRAATNNGQVTFSRDATVRFAYFKGDNAAAKSLIVATRAEAGGAWHQAVLPAPAGARYANRATLGLTAGGQPVVAYQLVEQPDLSLAKLSLGLAFGAADAFTAKLQASATTPGSTGQQASLALDSGGVAHVVHLSADLTGTQLVYTHAAAGSTGASSAVEMASDASGVYTDAGIAIDSADRLHLGYARAGHLYYRTAEAGVWGPATVLNTAGCTAIPLATTAVGGKNRRYVAFLCTRQAGDAASCALQLASSAGAAGAVPATWQVTTAALLDPAAACLPFNSQRPALAVDSQGRAHLFYRYTDPAHAGKWDVAYAQADVTAAAAAPAVALGDWSETTGFPLIALDGSDRPYVLYLSGGAVRFATADGAAALKPETVAFDAGDGVSGEPLELSDLLVHGGRGHGFQSFSN